MTVLPSKYTDVIPLSEKGRNGDVWRATNANLNRKVFLKAYPIPAHDPESALREPKVLQELDHPNLAKIFDADDIGGRLLLEMELIDGGSLQGLIDECTATGLWVPVHHALDLARDIANGVAYMHSRRFIHRDLKPANVMLRTGGGRRRAAVTDLGLASRLGESGRVFPSKHALLYRPPEVWEGKGYSPVSDVYQVGVILFQLLGGRINYALRDLKEREVGDAILGNQLLQWHGFPPHVQHSLRAIIEKSVGPEAERFVQVSDLALALHNCKKKQGNWTYSMTTNGFVLEQTVKGGIDRIDVRHGPGGEQVISRSRRVNTPGFRRDGKPIKIRHDDLGHSLKFKRVLAKRRA